jgi:hypothetical protein
MAASLLSLIRIMPVYADADTGIVKIRLATHFVERDRYSQRFFSHPNRRPLERLQRITWVDGRLEFRPCQNPRLKLGKPAVVGKTECGFRYKTDRQTDSEQPNSLNLELFRSIDPDFGLSFVHLDSPRDFDVLSFDAGRDR